MTEKRKYLAFWAGGQWEILARDAQSAKAGFEALWREKQGAPAKRGRKPAAVVRTPADHPSCSIPVARRKEPAVLLGSNWGAVWHEKRWTACTPDVARLLVDAPGMLALKEMMSRKKLLEQQKKMVNSAIEHLGAEINRIRRNDDGAPYPEAARWCMVADALLSHVPTLRGTIVGKTLAFGAVLRKNESGEWEDQYGAEYVLIAKKANGTGKGEVR